MPLLNKIHYGDNLKFMNSIKSGEIDLIYIDPPFFTQSDQSHKCLGKEVVFTDSWVNLNAYLDFIIMRLEKCHRLLKDTGVLCVHLDWRSVHYVKIELDKIFGMRNFVNEIIWSYKSGGAGNRAFAKKHDTILIYSKSQEYTFNIQKEKSYNRELKKYNWGPPIISEFKDNLGWYTIVHVRDVWGMNVIGRTAKERVGYPTQKPLKLLNRLIKAFTRKGDIVADFFCGSGTTLVAAKQLGRNFIGCDISKDAISISNKRLSKTLYLNKESSNAIT